MFDLVVVVGCVLMFDAVRFWLVCACLLVEVCICHFISGAFA